MSRIAILAALAALAGCAPQAPPGTPLTQAELQAALPGRTSDFGNGVQIGWKPDGTFTYDDRYETAGPTGTVGSRPRWGTYGTYALEAGQVCLRFQGTYQRCDGIFRAPSGELVATITGYPYKFVLR